MHTWEPALAVTLDAKPEVKVPRFGLYVIVTAAAAAAFGAAAFFCFAACVAAVSFFVSDAAVLLFFEETEALFSETEAFGSSVFAEDAEPESADAGVSELAALPEDAEPVSDAAAGVSVLTVLSGAADPVSDAMTGVTENREITRESDNSQAKCFARLFFLRLWCGVG